MPTLTILGTSILLSYKDSVTFTPYNKYFSKTDLSSMSLASPVPAITAGAYLSVHDMFVFFDATQEGVRENPDGTDTLLTTSLLTSASPYSTLYLYTQDQSLLFNFYTDKNFFNIRAVSEPYTFLNTYDSPESVNLP